MTERISVLRKNGPDGHYIVLVDGKFYCTCDNEKEVQEEINGLKQQSGC